jgi:GR25 family glycosyltransferase involved in LPS biosynthesis
MKAYVITITTLQKSVDVANRCIESGKQFGIDVEIFPAITPNDDIFNIAKERKVNLSGFDEKYSRKENAIACFLSHQSLWMKSIEINENILILEHDAVFKGSISDNINFKGLISLGKPSYGKYNIPKLGVGPLVSKQYLPGAHAYIIKPSAAKELMNKSKICAKIPDIFMDIRTFPWIEEYYPWPIEAVDTFSTTQKIAGCIAKHNYKEGFEII